MLIPTETIPLAKRNKGAHLPDNYVTMFLWHYDLQSF